MAWKQSASNEVPERRGGLRHAASAAVRLDAGDSQVEGQLIDRSATGFRIAYCSGELSTGLEVDFVIGDQQGRARVVWNRFTQRHWESGLLVL